MSTHVHVSSMCTLARASLHMQSHACLPSLFAPHQEPDDFTVAQSTPLPKDIIGLAGDTVRKPRHRTYRAALRFSGRISLL